MPPSSASSRGGWSTPRNSDEGWGPATSVRSGESVPQRSATRDAPERPARPAEDGWSSAGPLSARDQRATRRADQRIEQQIGRMRRPRDTAVAVPKARERGLPWWAALLVLIVIAVVGGIIDTVGSIDVKGGFNIGIVVASVLAILIVKRSHMFPIVIAPPIVYSLAAVFQLYIRSSGLHDKKVVFDAAANYLVYGFPAIAVATAAVLIIAGIRLITRK